MKERKIEINLDLETARKWRESSDETLRELALLAFSKDELDLNKTWKDYFLGKDYSGYWIDEYSKIKKANLCINGASEKDKNVFKTKKQAESSLAYAQLTQLMAHPDYNGDWVPDWNGTDLKYVIVRNTKYLVPNEFYYGYEK